MLAGRQIVRIDVFRDFPASLQQVANKVPTVVMAASSEVALRVASVLS
jgi:hypothetical protein